MSPGPEAWHEAGHALAAHLLGGVVRELTLESERDDFDGHVAVEWPATKAALHARRLALVALAGPVAELMFRGAVPNAAVLSAWRRDWAEAEAQLAHLEADPSRRVAMRHGILRELYESFDDVDNYEQLARLADALDAHGTLDDVLFQDAIADRA